MSTPEELRRYFAEMYGREPRLFTAPGRVNLIGEHTDYNEGFVLPVAIDRHTNVAAAKRDDRIIHVHSRNLDTSLEFDLDAPFNKNSDHWLHYIEGVARVLESKGNRLTGADLLLESNVPDGAGLSSSAALEMSVGYALLSLSGLSVDKTALALAGQEAEHTYVGANIGIMDQFISALGQAGHALLIDCRLIEATPIPFNTTEIALVVCDTHVKHSLATSEYNTRRRECEEGVAALKTALPDIRALRDVSLIDFDRHGDLLPDPVFRRCRHVVTENVRTLTAAIALRAGDFEKVGRLMYQSHLSLRDDYEVSCPELDVMVDIASSVNGVIGSRMTGGGFGGCTVNLVQREALGRFQEIVARDYQRATEREAGIYICEVADGVKELG